MLAFSQKQIKKEFLNELRNADLISTTIRGVTTIIDQFNGTGALTTFRLTNNGVKNIRSVTVNAVAVLFGSWDYVESIVGGNVVTDIVFSVAPVTGTNNVDIQYDYSSTGDRIYPDFPKSKISNDNFPRIGFDISNVNTQELALGATINQSSITISIIGYGKGLVETETLIDSIRSFMINKKKGFVTLNFITQDFVGPMLIVQGTNDKILQRNLDYVAPFEFEV